MRDDLTLKKYVKEARLLTEQMQQISNSWGQNEDKLEIDNLNKKINDMDLNNEEANQICVDLANLEIPDKV